MGGEVDVAALREAALAATNAPLPSTERILAWERFERLAHPDDVLALLDRLLAAEQDANRAIDRRREEMTLRIAAEAKAARVEAELNERLPCAGCVEYPEETCPRHGRLLTEWLERSDVLQGRVNRARELITEWTSATCQTDGAPCSWHRVSAECAEELRAALDLPGAGDVGGGGS